MAILSVGYIAAIVSCLSFGSFAVPIKGRVANEINIDPLVMQTYKTSLCFLTCWLVLLVPNVHFSFTYWGLLSGLAWIPGGTAGIYAVRNAGLAVSQGTWSALKVAIAFVWGIGVFQERVRSRTAATIAVVLLIAGLWGMSFFSSRGMIGSRPGDRHDGDNDEEYSELEQPLLGEEADGTNSEDLLLPTNDESEDDPDEVNEERSRIIEDDELSELTFDDEKVNFRCFKLHRRTVGLICACIDGIWGGSILVPMHFAGSKTEGLGYVISFAIGATTILIVMWIIRIVSSAVVLGSVKEAVRKLPPLHLRKFWLQGSVAGLLWSIGNVCSILSVEHLGEGVGYSIVQAQMLVAGLWGVLWYREVQGWYAIAGWFCCALTTLSGILLLSHEHLKTEPTNGVHI